MIAAPFSQRAEPRLSMRMCVKLSDRDTGAFELTPTVNVSCHGARVETKKYWEIGHRLWVRSIRGNLYSLARVAYCAPREGLGYVVGLDFQNPTGDWTRSPSSG